MTNQDYRSKIEFKRYDISRHGNSEEWLNGEDYLYIEIEYKCPTQRWEIDSFRRYNEAMGKNAPMPKKGAVHRRITSLGIKLGRELYIGLPIIHAETPHILPKLVEDLVNYKHGHSLDNKQPYESEYYKKALIDHALDGLRKIMGDKNE